MVLDEAANIAPLAELDALASTAAGHGIQLVSVWQDLAQITARYGPRAPTVVNNHRAKVFLSGIADPATLDHASRLIGDEELLVPSFTSGGSGGGSTTRATSTRRLAPPDALRRIPPGEGVLVYGGLPPVRLRLRTWFDDPVLAARARAGPPWEPSYHGGTVSPSPTAAPRQAGHHRRPRRPPAGAGRRRGGGASASPPG